MIGKIKKGQTFGGCIRYVMGKGNAQLSWNKPEMEPKFEPKKPRQKQAESQIQSYKPSGNDLIEEGLGLFTPSESNPQEEQIPYDELLRRQMKKKKRKGRGI